MIEETVTVPRELLERLVGNTVDLISERDWWKNESRGSYKADYTGYLADVDSAEKILNSEAARKES
jgi:hypothetical protein